MLQSFIQSRNGQMLLRRQTCSMEQNFLNRAIPKPFLSSSIHSSNDYDEIQQQSPPGEHCSITWCESWKAGYMGAKALRGIPQVLDEPIFFSLTFWALLILCALQVIQFLIYFQSKEGISLSILKLNI